MDKILDCLITTTPAIDVLSRFIRLRGSQMVVCNKKVADHEYLNPLTCLTGFMTFICKVFLYPKKRTFHFESSNWDCMSCESRFYWTTPIRNHCTGQEQQSYGMGKSNSHPESHSVERVQTSVHGPFPSFLPPLSTPTKHTFTLGRQRSDRPAQQEKNIHSNFYSSFMQMTLVKLERSGI